MAPPVGRPALIRTPDQRLRVFVSSTLAELAAERAAARAAIERLRFAPVMFELGARPHPPRALYRAYLEQSHVFVGIYWQSYGWVAPGMTISGIEDEYRLAGGKPCLLYVKEPAPERQAALSEFIEHVAGEGRVSFKRFDTAGQLAELVADDLSVLLTERFEAAARDTAGPAALRPRPPPAPLTGLIGRDRELETVGGLVTREDVRLLTLSGVGGVGKTRLALAVADAVGDRFADGVAFADLSSVASPDLVPTAVAAAAGVAPEGTRPVADVVAERLADARALLILDNFEHVLGASPFVSRLLAESRSLTVMVTSRVLLRVRGEHEFPVAPLETPPPGEPVPADVRRNAAAVRLFVDRARHSDPAFTLEGADADAVASLCSRLDGIPLAIELAASRLRILPPRALLDRIGERLDLLAGPSDLPARQRTLRGMLDWSYDLLDEPERLAFTRLSVFVSGFTLEGAEAVIQAPDALGLVSSLIEQSLVLPASFPGAEPRFRMIDLVRRYARERLEHSGAADEPARRMAEHFADVAGRAASGLASDQHSVWLSRIDPEADNIRAVIAWTMAHQEFGLCLRVMVPLWVYWWARGHVPELAPLAERILALNPPLEPPGRALLLQAVASGRALTAGNETARPVLRELLELCQALGDERAVAMVQAQRAASVEVESPDEARALLRDAPATLLRLGDEWGAAYAFGIRGQVALLEGDTAGADRAQAEALRHAEAVGSDHIVGLGLNERGLTALAEGDLALAHARFAASAEVHRRVRDREGLAYCLDGLASLALARRRPELAALGAGAADGARDKIGMSVWPFARAMRAPVVAAARAAVGPDAFGAAYAAGKDADPEQAAGELLAATA